MEILSSLAANYHWELALLAGAGIIALSLAGRLFRLIPAFGASHRLNAETLARKMEKPNYAANQQWNRKWGAIFVVAFFGGIVPFTLTLESQPWWRVPLDLFVILMVYDFFYYLMHRFLFHDSAFMGGPMKQFHAIHHRQHNPCRQDSSYIHPVEVGCGLGLFIVTILLLSLFMGPFHVVTFVLGFVAFSSINLHNHTLWESERFPFGWLNYASKMHHHHHAKFTGGNFATITLLFDWMFGTLDDGKGYGRFRRL